MFGGMGNMLKQAQVMQERMAKAQEDVAAFVATGESGGGLVKATMNGTASFTAATTKSSNISLSSSKAASEISTFSK